MDYYKCIVCKRNESYIIIIFFVLFIWLWIFFFRIRDFVNFYIGRVKNLEIVSLKFCVEV